MQYMISDFLGVLQPKEAMTFPADKGENVSPARARIQI